MIYFFALVFVTNFRSSSEGFPVKEILGKHIRTLLFT